MFSMEIWLFGVGIITTLCLQIYLCPYKIISVPINYPCPYKNPVLTNLTLSLQKSHPDKFNPVLQNYPCPYKFTPVPTNLTLSLQNYSCPYKNPVPTNLHLSLQNYPCATGAKGGIAVGNTPHRRQSCFQLLKDSPSPICAQGQREKQALRGFCQDLGVWRDVGGQGQPWNAKTPSLGWV